MPSSPPDLRKFLLYPFSALFGGMVEIRNHYFDKNLIPAVKFPIPTISVGNIAVGGTGKTPVVKFLSDHFGNLNKKVCVLTRGYGRKSSATIFLTSANLHRTEVEETGDEPRILARGLQNGAVVVDSNRWRGGKKALRIFKPDLFILDDAFQHRKVRRDIDIVTLDATDLWGSGFLLPAGRLREPLSQLKRADLLWVNNVALSKIQPQDLLADIKNRINKPVLFSNHCPVGFCRLRHQDSFNLESFQDKPVVAFCGIAKPESFKQTIERLGVKILKFVIFRDHQQYGKAELVKLLLDMKKNNAACLVTTEKDAVRVQKYGDELLRDVFYLKIAIKISGGEEKLKKLFENKGLI